MFYQMNSFMLANEMTQYFRNTSIATAVKQNLDVTMQISSVVVVYFRNIVIVCG